jgi:hypothetical protein
LKTASVGMAETSGGRGAVKVVARYTDGRLLKGTTLNFSPSRPTFFHKTADGSAELKTADASAEPVTVRLSDLKAVFFVRDLTGNAEYHETKEFQGRPAGKKVVVTFTDGERLTGSSLTYDAAREGFFLFPADPQSNNERIYVIMKAVSSVEQA